MLEGWTGWLERGGIFRLFVAVCDKREKEGGYIPLGRGKAIQMRNRIGLLLYFNFSQELWNEVN